MGARGSFSEVKRPGRAVDSLPPSSPEVTNAWSSTSTPTIGTTLPLPYLGKCLLVIQEALEISVEF